MIYVLPGMGADRRMYPAPWDQLPECTFIEWPPYDGEQSLEEMAARIVRLHGIQRGSWLVGSSLGGMVAAEIARLAPPQGLILVGSARSRDEVGALLRLATPLIDLVPLAFIRQLTGKVPSELVQMFRNSDPAFVRAMCRAIMKWDGITDPALPVSRIHGRHDVVIPLPAQADFIIEGGHLIAMTHAAECVDWVQEIIARSA